MSKSWKIVLISSAITIAAAATYILLTSSKLMKNICKRSFIFIGDSLTASTVSYSNQLILKCPGLKQISIAQVSMQTSWMLQQLQNTSNINQYDIVSVWGGIKDIYGGQNISTIKSNIQNIINLVHSNGAKVAILTVLNSASYSRSTDATIEMTDELNQWIMSNSSIDYVVDVNQVVSDSSDVVKSQYLSSDNLHLNQAGQSEVLKLFMSDIQ